MRQPMHWPGAAGLALAGLLALGALPAAAQAPTGWALKATPQHLVLSGYWLEAEHARPAHPRQTLTLGPQLYWGPAGHPDVVRTGAELNRDPRVRGGGLQLQHRFYLGAGQPGEAVPTGFYLGYGPQVQVFRLSVARLQWYEEPSPFGTPFLAYGLVRHPETVLRYGVAGQLGYQWHLGTRGLLDVYAGLGVRKSHYWSEYNESQFRSGPSDYAHQGLYVPAGFKLGVVL